MALSAQQARLQEDLRGLFAGEVRCDDVTTQLYASDASDFEVRPLGVVWPRSASEVAAVVRYCAERGIPVHPRGAGTGSAGGALGRGIILDFTRSMRRILKAEEDGVVTVQPGAVRERFNDILKRSGNRFFPPSSRFLPTGTLGGIIAADIAGPRWLKYGYPHQYVREMEVVTAAGDILELDLSDEKRPDAGAALPAGHDDSALASTVKSWHQSPLFPIREEFLSSSGQQAADNPSAVGHRGYALVPFGDGKKLNPIRLFCGSEGSLGIITKLKLATVFRPACTVSMILLFDSLEATARSVETILEFKPALCELIDRRTINLMTNRDDRLSRYLPPDAETALLLEFDSDSAAELSNRTSALTRHLREKQPHCFGTWSSIDDKQRELFGEMLKKSEQAAREADGPFRTVSLLGDISVPVERLGDFWVQLQRILRSRDLTCAFGGHIGQGQIRIQPILPAAESMVSVLYSAAEEVLELTVDYGGRFASAGGFGLARSCFLPRFFPEEARISQEVKTVFDPAGMMNPGKVVSEPDSRSNTAESVPGEESVRTWPESLRLLPNLDDLIEASDSEKEQNEEFSLFDSPVSGADKTKSPRQNSKIKRDKKASPPDQLQIQLKWDRRQIASDVYRCNGCGVCRSRTPGLRTCPNFRHYPDEQVSCRAKANVLRGILDGKLPLDSLIDDDIRLLGEQCLMCHCCPIDCPTRVDVAKMAFRIRSAQNAAHGMALGDKFLAYFERIVKIASVFSCPTNLLIHHPLSRWLGEKIFGVAQGRKFPRLERRSFLSQVSWPKRYLDQERPKKRKVALFVDTFANYFDVPLARAAVQILEHNGTEVIIPTRQRSSGHEAFVLGHPERAAALARANVSLYADLIRQGCRVVSLEPLSAVCLNREYRWLSDDPETRLLADHVTDITFYLRELMQQGELAADFAPIPIQIAYHAPCRTIALAGSSYLGPTPAEELLRLIPGLGIKRIERGCCGLAGPEGLKKRNYAVSLRLGMPLFLALREPTFDYGVTECSFCRMQMEQGGGKSVLHPVKLLAASYGLTQEPEKRSGFLDPF